MKNTFLRLLLAVFVIAAADAKKAQAEGAPEPRLDELAQSFANPPPAARPWVYWTWIDGNMNKAGITADLEAMQRVGIGGALILDVSQSMPAGPMKFFDAQWQALFKHTVAEAKRLGMEINMNNGVGYYGSGGPWVPPEKAMQKVVASETPIQGGAPWKGQVPLPGPNKEYRDIAVLAVAENVRSKYQIPDFTMKALQWKTWIAYKGVRSASLDAVAPADAIIPLDGVINLTDRMAPDGSLSWDAPAGNWTILRFGHIWTGATVGPSHPEDTGPETDKLDKAATCLHFDAFVKRLNEIVGAEGKGTLVATHIDSWEGGAQTWTGAMREEFKKRRGYDIIPYLPILTGRVLGDLQITERFLFDLRKTVSELMQENYSAEFQRLAHAAGLRNTYESYTTIGQDLDNANFADEPMAEFWTPNGQGLDFQPTIKSMSSAAHLNGLSVVGAEAFTSGSREKWLWHPAMLKSIGDVAFCGGVNRFVFHRYAGQPFGPGVKPGMQMGPWGLHYERTNTWWEFSKPWHEYLTRCQYLLRQGAFVADALKLESEEPLRRFQEFRLTGYDYDVCGPDTLLRAEVRESRLVFPGGAAYRLLVLPDTPTMSVKLLTRIRDLVRAGAVILGDPPQKTPGLTDYPKSDEELRQLVEEIWGVDPTVNERPFGKGRVCRGFAPEKALAKLDVWPDFTSDAGIRYIHRTVGNADVYFLSHSQDAKTVANCTFRVARKTPELWNAETGRISPLPAYSTQDQAATTLSIPFEPNGSAFIVFKPSDTPPPPALVSVMRGGIPALENGLLLPGPPGSEPDLDLARGEIYERGAYVFTASDGRSREVKAATSTVAVRGPWQVRFPAGGGAPSEIKLDDLISWDAHPDPGVKYFSGAATYAKTLVISAWKPDQRVYLGLGKVQAMARIRLNGRNLGVLWKPPYRVDITSAAKVGDNALEIEVVNLWVNRLIGDERLTEDSERNKNGTLKSWPQWLLEGRPSPAGRLTFSSWRLWEKDAPLQESGLLGPVTLNTVQSIQP
jgi:hypothetical protein